MYKVSCDNEWCSGKGQFAIIEDLPEIGMCCPVCGWTALPGSGIEELVEETEE